MPEGSLRNREKVQGRTRYCSRCGDFKPLGDFLKQPLARRGRGGWCKGCRLVYNRDYYRTAVSAPPAGAAA